MLSTANDKAPLSCSIYTKEKEELIWGGVITFSTGKREALKHKRASLGSLLHSNWMTHLTHSKQVFLYQRDLIFWTPCYEKSSICMVCAYVVIVVVKECFRSINFLLFLVSSATFSSVCQNAGIQGREHIRFLSK